MDDLSKEEIFDTLHGSSIFENFREEEISSFMELCYVEHFEEDDLIYVEGNPGDSAHILIEGSVDVVKGIQGGDDELLITMRPPCVLGEIGFVSHFPRSASVRCKSDVKSLKIDRLKFEEQVREDSLLALKFGLNLSRILASRLYSTDEALVKLLSELQKEGDTDWAYHDLRSIRQILYKGLTDTN